MSAEIIKGLNPYNEPEFYRLPGVRRDFSGTTPIIGNGSLTSGVVQVSGYAYFISEIKADQPCTIAMYWYSDSAGSNLLSTVSYSYATAQGLRLISGSVSADYLKIIITNTTATNMTAFWHRLKLSATPSLNLAEVETNQEEQLVALADIETEINDEALATRNTIESVGEELEANITTEHALTRATVESVGEELEVQINLVTTEINDELLATRNTIESVGEELEANITAEHALTRTEINGELATTRATIESVGEEIEASLLAVQNEVSDEALATRNTIESVGEEIESNTTAEHTLTRATVESVGEEIETAIAETQNRRIVGVDYVAGQSGIDANTETLQTIGYEHHEIHAGSHFMLCNYVDLSINQVYDIQITTPNTTKESHLVFGIEVESETIVQLFEGVTIALAGSALGVRNNNRNSATVTGMTVNGILNSSTANADADTVISAATIMEQAIIGVGKGSLGSTSRENEIVLKKNASYSLRFTATSAGYINYCLQWYEHIPKN